MAIMTRRQYLDKFRAMELRRFLQVGQGLTLTKQEYDQIRLGVRRALTLNLQESVCDMWLATDRARTGLVPRQKSNIESETDSEGDSDIAEGGDVESDHFEDNYDGKDDDNNINDGDNTNDGYNNGDDSNDINDSITNDGYNWNSQPNLDDLFNHGISEGESEDGEFNADTSTYVQQQPFATPPLPPLPASLKASIKDTVGRCEEREQDLIARGFHEGTKEFFNDPIRRELSILQQEAIGINMKEYMLFRFGRVTDDEGNDLPGAPF
ncbi:hypothetical protein HBI70_182370 [Parastagonospora nodorum]|nr:hypothetical protein HBH52_208430 [Parastagonospora nodorum]KAH4114520.1 hypothetical protein HBH47_195300 [Parastagonospora nodorum]KAH4845857.1 hypothetical protein HBH75_177760 [Parastagonospora nodorum]KAH4916626.1 hypothetical protein HBH74_141260 [Parastagonospora nodorum]KAH4924885.1 hypothetical protein HBI79_156490 [Parastagonospora nodorum]